MPKMQRSQRLATFFVERHPAGTQNAGDHDDFASNALITDAWRQVKLP